MSEGNRSLRRFRNGRQKQTKFQMIGAAATLLSHGTGASTTSPRNDRSVTLPICMEAPKETVVAQQRNSEDDAPLENENHIDSSSIVSSDEEQDLVGLTEVDDEELCLLDNVTSSVDPSSVDKGSTLVANGEIPALELVALCQEVSAPQYLYDKIVGILKRHDKSGALDVKNLPSREILMRNLRKKLNPPIASAHMVQTAGGADIKVTKFAFLEQLRDLLGMSYFDSTDNICANKDESQRFLRYQATEQDELLEVCSCTWYNQTYEMLGVARKKRQDDGHEVEQFLLPLIFYVDKTGTDVFQRYPLEPLMFTTAILRRDIRRKADAWRHLGFIPPVKASDSKKALNNMQAYHDCLSVLLRDLIELQQHPPMLEVNLGGIKKLVSVRLPVAFVIGDQMSQDALCGKRPSSTNGTPRIHRACMCSHLQCTINGKPNHSKHVGCKPIPLQAIKQLTIAVTSLPHLLEQGKHGLDVNEATRDNEEEILLHKAVMRRRADLARKILNNTLGLYEIDNAFNPVCFGSNENGIHSATLNDIMHFNEGGLFLNLAQVAYGIIPPKRRQDTLEKTISGIFSTTRSSVRSDYPRGFFKTGFSDLTLLTSVEKVGVVFALLVALRLNADIKSDLFQREVVDSQNKYLTFPLGSSDGDVKPDPDIKCESKQHQTMVMRKNTNKGGKEKGIKATVTPKTIKGVKGSTKSAAMPKMTIKGERGKKRKSDEMSRNHLQSFPLTSATLFLRHKGKNRNEKMHYPLSTEGIRSIGRHLKLHGLREILDVHLDALQLHYLLRNVWEVVSSLTDDSYPTTSHEIISLSEEEAPEPDDSTVAVYSYYPPDNDDHNSVDCDDREAHFRSTFVEHFGLEILKEQICAFDEHMEDDFLSMYGIENEVSSPAKRRRSSKNPNKNDEIQTKANGDVVLLAGSLKKVPKKDKSARNACTFIAKHGREKKGVTATRTCAVLSDVDTFCQMLEITLLHHAYLHYSETLGVEQRRDLSTLQKGIEHYMELVDKCVYRGDGSLDNATCKFHCHFQTCKVVPIYGDPSQYEAGSCERGLKTWAKKASRTAQKNKDVQIFSCQTASRVADSLLLSKACDMTLSGAFVGKKWINPWHKAIVEMSDKENTQFAGNYFFARKKPHYRVDILHDRVIKIDKEGKDIPGSATGVADSEIHSHILYGLQNTEDKPAEGRVNMVLPIWTELRDEVGNYVRAMPYYPSIGPWYDWVMVHFIHPATGEDTFLPAKCLLFYEDRHGEPSALVHGVDWDPIRDRTNSLLFTEWQREYNTGLPSLTKVPLTAIQRAVLAFETNPYGDAPLNPHRLRRPDDIRKERVVVVHPRSTWATKFHEWCQHNS